MQKHTETFHQGGGVRRELIRKLRVGEKIQIINNSLFLRKALLGKSCLISNIRQPTREILIYTIVSLLFQTKPRRKKELFFFFCPSIDHCNYWSATRYGLNLEYAVLNEYADKCHNVLNFVLEFHQILAGSSNKFLDLCMKAIQCLGISHWLLNNLLLFFLLYCRGFGIFVSL